MEPEPIEQVVRNIDLRLSKVEKILPTLPTRTEMGEAIVSAIADAVAPLATKVEVREEGGRTRRHFDVVADGIEHQIKLLAARLRQRNGPQRGPANGAERATKRERAQ